MFGGFPPATAASTSVGRLEPALRTVTLIPVFFSKGFSAVAKPVASPPENSFHTDTDPPILLDDALAELFTAITENEASIAAAVAVTTARFPKNLMTLKFPPSKIRASPLWCHSVLPQLKPTVHQRLIWNVPPVAHDLHSGKQVHGCGYFEGPVPSRPMTWRPHFAPRRSELEHDYSLDGG
jgi:hypothetical protein